MPTVLTEGAAGVFVTVADSSNNPIIEPKANVPIGMLVTSFHYTYSEEDDDECEIVIQCDNPDLISLPQFTPQRYLLVQWGLLYSNGSNMPSPIRKVMIRDVGLTLNSSENVSIKLTCTDGYSLTKLQSAKNRDDKNFLTWIDENLSNNYKVKYEVLDTKKVSTSPFINWLTKTFSGSANYGNLYGMEYYRGKVTDKNSESPKSGTKAEEGDVLIKQRLTMQIGKSANRQMKDAVKSIPNGPYYVDGRDDEVTIHPPNFNQPALNTFYWKSGTGELLSVNITTAKKDVQKDTSKTSSIDGDTKEIVGSLTQSDTALNEVSGITGSNESSKDPNYVDGMTGAATITNYDQYSDKETTSNKLSKDENLLKKHASEYLDQVLNTYNSNKDNPELLTDIGLEPLTVKVKAKVKEQIPTVNSKSRNNEEKMLGKQSNNVQVVPKSDGSSYKQGELTTVIVEKEIEVELQPTDLLGFAGSVDNANLIALNDLNESIQKQVQADIKLVGQPYLESSKIINLQNISTKYSGDWYIKEVKHSIDITMGYICDIEAIKKGVAYTGLVQSTIKVNTPTIASKIQKIAKEQLDPVKAAKIEEIKSAQEYISKQFEDYGSVTILTDDEGYPVHVEAEKDWVNLDKETKTDNVNRVDKSLQNK